MITVTITDNSITASVIGVEPEHIYYLFKQEYLFDTQAIYQLTIFNNTALQKFIKAAIATTKNLATPIIVGLQSTALLEYWQDTTPEIAPEYYIKNYILFGKNYYAALRHDQLLQYKLLFTNTNLICLSTITIAQYYAHIYFNTLQEQNIPQHLSQLKTVLQTFSATHIDSLELLIDLGLYRIGVHLHETT